MQAGKRRGLLPNQFVFIITRIHVNVHRKFATVATWLLLSFLILSQWKNFELRLDVFPLCLESIAVVHQLLGLQLLRLIQGLCLWFVSERRQVHVVHDL